MSARTILGIEMYLIDTNVISEARKEANSNRGVYDFFRRANKEGEELFISVITLGEIRRGIEKVRYRGDEKQAKMLGKWLHGIRKDFADHVLPLDEDVAEVWGRLRVPNHENAIDKLIAATALIHDLTVVTRNVEDFSGCGVRLLNPFDG